MKFNGNHHSNFLFNGAVWVTAEPWMTAGPHSTGCEGLIAEESCTGANCECTCDVTPHQDSGDPSLGSVPVGIMGPQAGTSGDTQRRAWCEVGTQFYYFVCACPIVLEL